MTYAWDLDNDGVFGETASAAGRGDETGVSPTFSAAGLDGPSTFPIALRVTDGSGQTATASTTVSITNVAPTLVIGGAASVNEGSPYALTLSAVDPGLDTVAGWLIDWGDGTTQNVAGNPSSVSHTYADGPAARTISATATDEDGTYAANTKAVTVNDVVPTIALSGSAGVNEGSSYSLTLGAVTDPGTDTVTWYTVDWGDGTSNPYATNGVKTHTYADGSAVRSIVVGLVNEDGSFPSAGTKSVTVNNVAPTLAFAGAATVDEGSTYTLGLSATDPGVDTISGWLIDWDDGQTQTVAGNPGSVAHVYADGATTRTIAATATDEDGSYAAATKTVTVQDVAPTIALAGAAAVNEGSAYALTLGAVTDPGLDTVTSYLVDWGDGLSNSYATNGVKTHVYADGTAVRTITVGLVDEDDTHAAAGTRSVTVNNVAPTLTISGAASVNEGSSYALSLSAVDPGLDTISGWLIDWGDGQTQNVAGNPTSVAHVYADGPAARTLSATATDEDGTYSSNTRSVTVNDVAPVIALAGAASVDEGSSYALTLGAVTDPGADVVSQYLVDWGDGLADVYAAGGVKTHAYADGTAVRTITVGLVDGDGTHAAAGTRAVTVANVAPTLALGGAASVNEGSAYTLALSASDPGADTVAGWTIDWGDGVTQNVVGSPSSVAHTYADGTTVRTIAATATDEDGTYAAPSRTVTVLDVAPTIALSGAASVNEGGAYSLTLGAVTDPGMDTVTSYLVDWGDGTSNAYGTAGAKSHTYADGTANRAITVGLVNEDGTFASAGTKSVTVNNVAPTLAVTGAATVNEGSSYALSMSAVDPGVDTISGWLIDWGDGQTQNVTGNPSSVAHVYADGPAARTIAASATDEDGTYAAATKAVTVLDVAPVIALSGAASVNEGSTYSLTLGAVTDPGQDAVTQYVVDWGDGLTDTYASAGAKTHTYADGSAARAISVALVNEDGTFPAAGTKAVTVNNVAPTLTISGAASVDEGSSYALALSAVDPGVDTITGWVIDWGDGTTQNVVGNPSSVSHTYASGPAARTISATAADEDGTYSSNTKAVVVNAVAPTIAISGNAGVNEGSAYTFTLGAVTDPGGVSVTSYLVDWGDGQTSTYASNGPKAHTYADGSASRTITVGLVDADGTHAAAATKVVNVLNVAPTLTATGPATVNEGASYALALSATDPGLDTVTGWTIDWGDGTTQNVVGTPSSVNHTYADGPSARTITASATDEDGTYAAPAKSVTVLDVAPTIALSGNASVDEGSAYSLTLGAVTDPGQDTVTQYLVDWGDGTSDTYGTNGVKAHVYADGPATRTITVGLVNEDGSFASVAAKAVTVAHVPPTLTVTGASRVNEGSAYTLNLAATDPGTDTLAGWTIDWGDGQTQSLPGIATSASHVYADGPAASTIAVSATDEDGTYTAAPKAVVVDDVAPTIALSGASAVAEGSTYTLTLGAVTDPGTDTVSQYLVDWGDGLSNAYGSAGAKTHVYASGNATRTITVALVDGDGTHPAAGTKLVTVSDVAPALTIGGPNAVNEGSPYVLTLSAVDAGTNTIVGWAIDWGDGTTQNVVGTPSSVGHVYANGPAARTISATATDATGTYSSNAKSVFVNDVAPTIALSGAATTTEGSAYALALGVVTDPGADVVTSYVVDWGDGQSGTYATNGPKAHAYADGNATRTISVALADADGTHAAAGTKVVNVLNVAPTLTATGPATVNEGSTYALALSATDPGVDTISGWTIDWGDGATQNVVGNPGSVDHVYADGPGVRTIAASATDEDGTYAAPLRVVTVLDVAPTIALAGNASVNEGSAYAMTLGAVTDPGTDTVTSYLVDWGDGLSNTYAANGVKTHVYADGSATRTVVVGLVNEDGTFAAAGTKAVTVNNVAPTLTVAGPARVNEGSAYTLNLSATDPGLDALTGWTIDWGDGTTQTVAGTATGALHYYADGPAAYTIAASAADEDGSYPAAPRAETVDDVAPTIALAGLANATEGSAYTLTLGAVTDPGVDTVTQYVVDWGDGQSNTYGTNGVKAHVYAGGNATRTITVGLVDEDGAHPAAGTKTVSVANVAPAVSVGGLASVNEGSPYVLSLSAVDAGVNTVSGWTIDWGDGATQAVAGNPGSVSHTYADGPAVRTISATATDADGTYAALPKLVAVLDVAPTVALFGDAAVNEGATYSLTLGPVTDPGADTVTSYLVDWGDGQTGTYAAGGTKTHVYADGTATRTIVVGLVDEDGVRPAAGVKTISVNNVAPLLSIAGPSAVDEGSAYTLNLSATDVGLDAIAGWTIDWGDGVVQPVAGNPASVAHVYADGPATRTIVASAADEDGVYAAGVQSVAVRDVAPAVALAGPAAVSAGTTYALAIGPVADPGVDTVSQYLVDWGDGTSDAYASAGVVTHAYAGGAATRTITVAVVDEDGVHAAAGTRSVDVLATPPLVTIAGAAEVDEGSPYVLTLSALGGAGAVPLAGVAVDWGDGFVQSVVGQLGGLAHVYADGSAQYVITATAADLDGVLGSVSAVVAVRDVAPTLAAAGAGEAVTGRPYAVDLGAVVDPGADTVTGYVVNWGDGTSDAYLAGDAGGRGLAGATHVYAAAGPAVVSVDVVDEDGVHAGAGGLLLSVRAPLTPVVAAAGAATATTGSPYAVTWSLDQLDGRAVDGWVVEWGDGTADTLAADATGAAHVYADPADRTVTVRAVIDGAGYAAAGLDVLVGLPPDVTAPTAALASAPGVSAATTADAQPYVFTVLFSDDRAVNSATLAGAGLRVTGPKGFSAVPVLVSAQGSGGAWSATYSVVPPGGSWDRADNGTYAVSLVGGQVRDTNGNAAAANGLGTFAVDVPVPSVAVGTVDNKVKTPPAAASLTPTSDSTVYRFATAAPLKATLKFSGIKRKVTVELVDAAGRVLATKTAKSAFSLAPYLPAGSYEVRVTLAEGKATDVKLQVAGVTNKSVVKWFTKNLPEALSGYFGGSKAA